MQFFIFGVFGGMIFICVFIYAEVVMGKEERLVTASPTEGKKRPRFLASAS
jgi:hypothetical protein